MLTREEFQNLLANGPLLLDGATGSNLQKAGMPKGCCTEEWVLTNPEPLVKLQRSYAEAGSNIIYAPTFQAQPIALARVGLERRCEEINAALVELEAEGYFDELAVKYFGGEAEEAPAEEAAAE